LQLTGLETRYIRKTPEQLSKSHSSASFQLDKNKFKKTNPVDLWWMSPRAMEKGRLGFNPQTPEHSAREFNLFNGLAITPESIKNKELTQAVLDRLEIFLNHFCIIFCGGDQRVTRYVLKWMRRVWVKPHLRTRVMILIIGRQVRTICICVVLSFTVVAARLHCTSGVREGRLR
jgi:hypothetical protein